MKLIKTGMGKTGMGKDFVMPLKSNRNIALSGQDKKDGRFQERRALSSSPNARTRAFRQSKRSNTGRRGKCIWNRYLFRCFW